MTEAERIIYEFLRSYQIDDQQFTSQVWQATNDGRLSEIPDMDEIYFVFRDTDVMKKRFAGNAERRRRGYTEYSPSRYLQLEDELLTEMRFAGLPEGFYDDPATDLAGFIGNDVSPSELQGRIQQGFRAVKEADPQVVAEFQRLYGVSEGDLAAYFLDPEQARPLFDSRAAARQAQAASVAAQATRQAQMQISQAQAEELAIAGVTGEQAQQGFMALGLSRDLYEPQMVGEQAVSQEEQIAGTFGTRAEAVQRIATRRRRRQAAFEAGGGFAGQQGQTGLGTVGQ